MTAEQNRKQIGPQQTAEIRIRFKSSTCLNISTVWSSCPHTHTHTHMHTHTHTLNTPLPNRPPAQLIGDVVSPPSCLLLFLFLSHSHTHTQTHTCVYTHTYTHTCTLAHTATQWELAAWSELREKAESHYFSC